MIKRLWRRLTTPRRFWTPVAQPQIVIEFPREMTDAMVAQFKKEWRKQQARSATVTRGKGLI